MRREDAAEPVPVIETSLRKNVLFAPRTFPATGITLLDFVPAGYQPVTVSPTKGTCGIKKKRVICSIDSLTNRELVNIQLVMRATGAVTVVTNCAEITTTSYDPNPDNHKACARIPPF
jgi:hypothetical protein